MRKAEKAAGGWRGRCRLRGIGLCTGLVIMLAGVVLWGGFNTALEATNSLAFCLSCHEMRDNIYPEYRRSRHFRNPSGVRATCPDCHVPRDWGPMVLRKVQASAELFHKLTGSIDTPEKFEARRLILARKVWQAMQATDSRECRNCHDAQAMALADQRQVARQRHEQARQTGQTCIDCHKGIAHSLPEAFLEQEHERFEREGRPCYECHEDMARAPEGDGWE